MRGAELIALAAALMLVALAPQVAANPGIGTPAFLPSPFEPPGPLSAPTQPLAVPPSVLFQRSWGGPNTDTAQAVTTDASGNIYVAGYSLSFGPCSPSWYALSLLKYSPLGTLLMQSVWSNGSGVIGATGIAVDAAGNIYVAGYGLWSPCLGGYWYALLLKFDSAGNYVWGRTLAETDSEFHGITLDASGNVYVTGDYYAPGNAIDMLILRFSPSGNVIWEKSWGGSGTDLGESVALDAAGNVYVAGWTTSYPAMQSNAVLLKLDPSGNLLLRKVVGNGNEQGTGIGVDATGNIYIAGTAYDQTERMLLLKFDASSGLLWQRTWGGPLGIAYAQGLALDASGNIEVAGYTNAYGSMGTCSYPSVCTDVALIKVSSSGNLLSHVVYGAANVNDQANAVTDWFGNAIAVGFTGGAPPYQVTGGNDTLGTLSLYATTSVNNTVGDPGSTLLPVGGGAVYPTSGNETFAGVSDESLMEYGTPPTLSFATDPAGSGTIEYNGASYVNGGNTTASLGASTVSATPDAGYRFSSWSTTGGVRVANATSNSTQVTVVGPGTLTAHFEVIPPQPGGLSVEVVAVAAGVIIVIAATVAVLYVLRRRRRGDVAPPGPDSPGPP